MSSTSGEAVALCSRVPPLILALVSTFAVSTPLMAQCTGGVWSPQSLTNARVNQPYDQIMYVCCNMGSGTYLVQSGSLPPGLVFENNGYSGELSGIPTVAGSWTFTVAANVCWYLGSHTYTLTVDSPCSLTDLLPVQLPNPCPATPYAQLLDAQGGNPPYTYGVASGSLPPGFQLDPGGWLLGTTSTNGLYSFSVRAIDSRGCTVVRPYTVQIQGATFELKPPDGTVNRPYRYQLSAQGAPPIQFKLTNGALPPGIQLSSWGSLSGTPTSHGTWSVEVEATTGDGCTATKTSPIRIRATPNPALGPGHGPSNPNRVTVLNSQLVPSLDFLAYTSGGWGTNVTSSDRDADSRDELLTGPGPGVVFGPHVRGFVWTGAPLPAVSFYAYGTLQSGVNVSGGDIDGDTVEDLLTGPGPGVPFGPHVRGWSLSRPVAATPGVNFFSYQTLAYGVRSESVELDGSPGVEIATTPGPGPTFSGLVRGWDPLPGITVAVPGLDFVPFTGMRYGANVAAGDLHAQNEDELIIAPGPGSTAHPATFRGFSWDGLAPMLLPGFDVTPFSSHYGGRPAAGEVTRDQYDDLVAGAGPDPAASATVEIYRYDGSALIFDASHLAYSYAYGVNPSVGHFGY